MGEVPLYRTRVRTKADRAGAVPRWKLRRGLHPPPRTLQGYLAHKKHPPPRTLQEDYAKGPVVVSGGGGCFV